MPCIPTVARLEPPDEPIVPVRPRRALLPSALTALEVIRDFKVRRIRVHDFELAMSQRGLGQTDSRGALASFSRRGWVTVAGSSLEVSDDGWLAVMQGIGVKTAKKAKGPGTPGNRRMPPGLF